MSTIETTERRSLLAGLQGLFVAILSKIEANRLHHARRKALIHLSHYDAHMLRDVGIDPRDIQDALNNRSRSLLFNPMRPNNGR